MFEILEAEFNPAGLNSNKVGAMCRIGLTFPADKPVGFANVDDAMMLDRIDKSFIEAQALLRITLGRLKRADSDTKSLVQSWFGSTTNIAVITARYEQVDDYVQKTLKHGAKPLEIRWSEQPKNMAATGFHATYMSFGTSFFDDAKAVPSTQLAKISSALPPGFVDSVKGLIAEWDKLNADKVLLIEIRTVAKSPGATLGEAMTSWLKSHSGEYPNTRAMAGAYAPLGFKPEDDKLAATERARVATLAIEQRETQMLAEAEAKRPPVSTSGVVIHELTHLVLNTRDVDSPLFKTQTPSYGASTCLHLASVSPADAIDNADNYRLFSESCGF